MKSKLAVRLSLYFSAALLALALLVGVIFFLLFRNYTLQAHKKVMAARAESIASALSGYLSPGGAGHVGGVSGAGKGGTGGYGAYLKFIDDIAGTPVWIVDENLQLLSGSLPGDAAQHNDINVSSLPADAGRVVKEVFEGKTTFSEGFSGYLNTPTLTAGTPIVVNGRIVGAVLLHAPVEGISDSVNQGLVLLTVSLAAALVITVAMSFFLAAKFTTPLRKMKSSTALLASGEYSVKTHIERRDEIGELAASIDILSEKLLEARKATERLDSLRRDFVANVSHELRTPVTVLRGSLEALCDGVVTDAGQVDTYHRQMLSETLSLQRLVNDLMELSRLQNAEFKIEMTELNLHDVLTDAARSAGQLASRKQIGILLEADTQVIRITGDYSRLKQMFLIILDNAVKFSPENSEVLISLNNAAVRIRDRGPGIPPEDLPHIFDRFYKTKSEDNKTGSGLGLAIAKQIAERHGMTLQVNLPETGGAEFVFQPARTGW